MAKKYIDADKLKAQIAFCKSVYDNPHRVVHGIADAFRQDGRAAMCDDIIKEIDSLQQKPEDVDMEKVFEKEYAKFSNDPDAMDYAFPIDLADYKDFARHFYELGLSARKED